MTTLAEQLAQEAAEKLARSMGKVIVWNTRLTDTAADVEGARLLLEAMGLIAGPDAHELVPVDGRPMGTSDHKATPGARMESVTTTERRAENCTTPPGLRDLPPMATPAARPARRKPRTLTEELEELEASDPDVAAAAASYDAMVEKVTGRHLPPPATAPAAPSAPRPVSRQPRANAARCGTESGYTAHLRRGEESCQECHEARRVAQSRRAADKAVAAGRAPGPRPRPPCGTYGGYRSHRQRKETACQPCKTAASAYQREMAAARRARAAATDSGQQSTENDTTRRSA